MHRSHQMRPIRQSVARCSSAPAETTPSIFSHRCFWKDLRRTDPSLFQQHIMLLTKNTNRDLRNPHRSVLQPDWNTTSHGRSEKRSIYVSWNEFHCHNLHALEMCSDLKVFFKETAGFCVLMFFFTVVYVLLDSSVRCSVSGASRLELLTQCRPGF